VSSVTTSGQCQSLPASEYQAASGSGNTGIVRQSQWHNQQCHTATDTASGATVTPPGRQPYYYGCGCTDIHGINGAWGWLPM